MSDIIDIANDLAQERLDASLREHASRRSEAVPLCEECNSHRVHVASNGCRWKYCPDCAYDLLGVVA